MVAVIEVLPGLYSGGWSDPAQDKLPFYGLPKDLTGMRVLDIGCAEGFFFSYLLPSSLRDLTPGKTSQRVEYLHAP